jgi:protein subunit release factor B
MNKDIDVTDHFSILDEEVRFTVPLSGGPGGGNVKSGDN